MSWLSSLQQSPQVSKALDAFNALSRRDQMAVKLLAGFLIPVLIIFVLMLPASAFVSEARGNYKAALEDYEWMLANRAAVPRAAAESAREPGQSLFGVANATSKGFQISFKRYEPVDDNALSLWIEGVSFNNLVLWLERLEKRYGITVREIAVERQDIEGQVNARLVLQG